MAELSKVQSGDPLAIPAETFNTFIDMARDYRSRQVGVAQSPQPSRSSGIVLVKNASGADRNRFDVLGVGAMLYGPADNLASGPATIATLLLTGEMLKVGGLTPKNAETLRRILGQIK